jgi:hypothetical protein
MATPEDTVCEACHERRANHFVCPAGSGAGSHLCNECFDSSTPPEVRDTAAAVRAAHCQYCGAQPCAGGTDFLALATGVRQDQYLCMPCTMEHQRFVQQQLSLDDSDLSKHEQLAVLRKLLDDADAHMKRWVAAREFTMMLPDLHGSGGFRSSARASLEQTGAHAERPFPPACSWAAASPKIDGALTSGRALTGVCSLNPTARNLGRHWPVLACSGGSGGALMLDGLAYSLERKCPL